MRSKRVKAAVVAALTVLSLAGVSTIAEANDGGVHEDTITVTPTSGPQTWQGDTATGANARYFTDFRCNETPAGADQEYCDIRLLHVDVPSDFWATRTGGLQVRLDQYVPPSSDFDLQIFESDANAKKGKLVGSSGNNPGDPEQVILKEAQGYYLIWVVYFAVTEGTYTGNAELFFRHRTPPDVDSPPGLQEVVASNLSEGWRSRSEMHLAQSPTNSNLLVAGSKFYNKDQDSLDEYEFKVGSYVSFNGGQGWIDLGQVRTCAPGSLEEELAKWEASTHKCYPVEDPAKDGTGVEDKRAAATVNQVPSNEEVAPGEQIIGSEFNYTNEDGPKTLLEQPVGPLPVIFADDQYGCDWSTAENWSEANGGADWIGLVRRSDLADPPSQDPSCRTLAAKFSNAEEAGASALIVINTTSGHTEVDVSSGIPGILVDKSDGDRLRNSLDANNPEAVQVTLSRLDRGGGGDFAEEYITSDPWVQFDDDGNAYFMALDHPPFESDVGWGMTLHKWESVSQEDVQSGNTWGDRIPINAYTEPTTRDDLGLLDDKNTFAVNNAGPDNESNPTNIAVSCWGQNVQAATKQQIVCERSVGGTNWDGEPIPISGAHQLVIGVHVIADKAAPGTFYAVWLQYASGIAGPSTLEFNMTTNGGVSWLPQSRTIATVEDIPRQFPRQGFRNLSIPIMAAGPPPGGGSGAAPLYVVIPEYLTAPVPATDEDDKQADIILYRSLDGGLTWTKAKNITENAGPNQNADQFQPYIDVTDTGQLNVIYFDRRHDVPVPPNHPGNYFTDVYLSRSNNGGQTWTDHRLTHDATDPEFNAPISGSGLFFGDYQGLVADNCVAIPFVNDTHLANDQFLDPGPERDPTFDEPDSSFTSPYQEAVNWRVPNTEAFGGTLKPDLTLTSDDITSSRTRIVKGKNTTLTAVVHNIGPDCADATNVRVIFKVYGVRIGEIQTIPSIPAGGTGIASVTWKPNQTGQRRIDVIVDPGNKIVEVEETNNRATKFFMVHRR
jgi:hypothetical protein